MVYKKGEAFPGHYDMLIEKQMTIFGIYFTRPVLSYRMSGSVDIFNEQDSYVAYKAGDNYYKDCDVYHWAFTIANDSKLNDLVTLLSGVLISHTPIEDVNPSCHCTIDEDNPFSHYTAENYNCFHAVSVWLDALGNNTLRLMYLVAHNNANKDYSPAAMAAQYSSSWTRYYP